MAGLFDPKEGVPVQRTMIHRSGSPLVVKPLPRFTQARQDTAVPMPAQGKITEQQARCQASTWVWVCVFLLTTVVTIAVVAFLFQPEDDGHHHKNTESSGVRLCNEDDLDSHENDCIMPMSSWNDDDFKWRQHFGMDTSSVPTVTCMPGETGRWLPGSTTGYTCELTQLEPNTSDVSMMEIKADPCRDPYGYYNGAWLRARDKLTKDTMAADQMVMMDRAFSHAARENTELFSDVLSVEILRTWKMSAIGAFFDACMHAHGSDAMNDQGVAIEKEWLTEMDDLLKTTGDVPKAMGWLLAHGFTAPFVIDVERALQDGTQLQVFLQQNGLLGIEADRFLATKRTKSRISHERLLLELFTHAGMDNPVEWVEDTLAVETALASHFVSTPETEDILEYVSPRGAYKQDVVDIRTMKWNHLNLPLVYETLAAEAGLDEAWVTEARTAPHWLYKPTYFTAVNEAVKKVPVQQWKAYAYASILFHSLAALPRSYAAKGTQKSVSLAGLRTPHAVQASLAVGAIDVDDMVPPHLGLNRKSLLPWSVSRQPRSMVFEQGMRLVSAHAERDWRLSAYRDTCLATTLVYLADQADTWFARERLGHGNALQRIEKMTDELKEAMAARLRVNPWLSATGKKNAMEKLEEVKVRIGGPLSTMQPVTSEEHVNTRDAQHDGSDGMPIMGEIYLANMDALRRHDTVTRLSPLITGAETVRDGPFLMPAATVNAYYDPLANTLNILAGILEYPFYSPEMSDASLLGALGTVLAHELSHAFDPNSVPFDSKGAVHDWLPEADQRLYAQKLECVERLYTGPTRLGNAHRGDQTLGENVADLTAMRLTLDVLKARGPVSNDDLRSFFFSYAQLWAVYTNAHTQALILARDVHSDPQFRVEKVLLNTVEYKQLYSCTVERHAPCDLW